MKVKTSLLVLFTLMFIYACKNEQQVKAKIFERKKQDTNKLLIKYRYVVDGKPFVDSSTIPNNVIDEDSVTVSIDPSEPGRGKLTLKQ